MKVIALMALPLRADARPDVLAEEVGRLVSIVRMPLPVAARLHQGGDLERPVLLLDPSADPDDLTRALIETLILLTLGPTMVSSARKVGRHLRVVP